MLKFKRVISAPSPNKKNEFTKLKTEIENDVKKLVNENLKILKSKDDYVKNIHQIRSEYQILSLENEKLKQYSDKLKKEKEKPKHWYDQYSYSLKNYQNNLRKRHISYNNNGYSSGDEEDGFYPNEYSQPKKLKSKKNQKVMYVPFNEDEVDFSENNFTDKHDLQDEDELLMMMRKMMKWLLTINI